MTTKTERITILVTPEFKAFLNSEADKEGVSVGELVRARCEHPAANDLGSERELLESLTQEIREDTQRASKSLDQGISRAEAVLAEIAGRRSHAK